MYLYVNVYLVPYFIPTCMYLVLNAVVPICYAWQKASQVVMHASYAVLYTLQLGNQIAAMYEATIPGSVSHINEVVRTVERAQYLCSGQFCMHMRIMPVHALCTCCIWCVSLLNLIHSLPSACQDPVMSV